MKIAISCQIHQINQRDFIRTLLNSGRDLDIYIITDSDSYPGISELPQKSIYHVEPAWPWFVALNRYHPSNKIRYRRIIEDINPDILLSLGVSAIRFLGPVSDFSPTVLLPQGGETLNFLEPWRPGLRGWLYWQMYRYQFKRALNSFDEIWTAKPNGSRYRDFGFQNEISDFDWGVVDTEEFCPREDAVQFSEPSDTIIGSFRRQRGERLLPSYEAFFEGIRVLSENRDDFHIVIGGFYDDEKGAKIEELIDTKVSKYNLESYITKIGMISKDEMPRYYSGLDIYMNFTHKGHPITGLGTASKEGMACQCSYVTFDDPAKDHIINHGENGYIVKHSQHKKLGGIFQSLCENENKCQSVGERARETIVKNFSKEAIRNKVVDHCQRIINEEAYQRN